MANTIIPAKEYHRIILDIYEKDSITNQLDSQTRQLPTGQQNPNEILLKKVQTTSLGDYQRNIGYAAGSATIGWETVKLELDRSTFYTLDRVDSIETLNTTIGDLVADFTRRHLIPEIDATRLARYANGAGSKKTITLTSVNILSEIDLASATMSNSKVPSAGRLLFVNQEIQPILDAAIPRQWSNEAGLNTNVRIYNGMTVIYVPGDRFYSGITLNTVSGASGYNPTIGENKVNFLMLDPKAVWQAVKVNVPKFVSADEPTNDLDSHIFRLRIFHDAGVVKVYEKGVYANLGGTV